MNGFGVDITIVVVLKGFLMSCSDIRTSKNIIFVPLALLFPFFNLFEFHQFSSCACSSTSIKFGRSRDNRTYYFAAKKR